MDATVLEQEEIYTSKSEEYTVLVRILEARQLAGLDIDPSVVITIGNQKKATKTKKSTNDPDYDETLIFEFVQPPAVFFDQLIKIESFHTTRILRRKIRIGSFKIDVGTVHRQPNKTFFHRWALLLDPLDPLSGPKGYVQCDIAVFKKGDIVKIPAGGATENDDIEANILLPDDIAENVSSEREPAKYILSIYSAEGLPSINAGVTSGLRKAITGSAPIDLIDAYVQVSFAGQTAKTKVIKDDSNPTFLEQIIFTELFPPLVRTMRLHVRDNGGAVVATSFLDLNVVADNSTQGFLPAFGPAYINLYGSYRDDKKVTALNFGLGEGLSYRGRLCLSLRVELEEQLTKKGLHNVEVKTCLPLPSAALGKKKDFFLFCTILEANMIDKRLAGKPLYFELSIGNYGCELDGFKPVGLPEETDSKKAASLAGSRMTLDEDAILEEEAKKMRKEGGHTWHSRTPKLKPVAKDNFFCYLPFDGTKPCMYIYSQWEDHRSRLFHVNILKRLQGSMEALLTDVVRLVEMEQMKDAIRRLKFTLDAVCSASNEYLSYLGTSMGDGGIEITPLDKEKVKQRKREVETICQKLAKIRPGLDRTNVISKLKQVLPFVDKLRTLAQEAQESIPDVFLWLVSGERRLAYQRFKAEDLLFSMEEEERGQFCAKPHSFFFKVPGRTQVESEDWCIWGHVTSYFWLGLTEEMTTFLDGLPKKFKQNITNKNVFSEDYIPPTFITYRESYAYEVRCHLFQGRALTPADDSGLSDPFVRVIFSGESIQSKICDQTVNPVWDQCLVLPVVKIWGSSSAIAENPPEIVIQVYDHDDVGENEFIGQAAVKSVVKMAQERYEAPKFPPALTWIPLYKAKHRVGEVLAAFEMIELEKDMRDYPQLNFDQTEISEWGILPVPKTIRPTLSPYSVNVLFWGLRDLNSPGLLSVEKPRVEIEVGGSVIPSTVIPSYKQSQNFPSMIESLEVMLPDDPLYRPPITIRCLDCRTFGRATLVGTHIISSIDGYMWEPPPQPAQPVAINLEEYEDPTVLEVEGEEDPILNGEINDGFVPDHETTFTEEQGSPSPLVYIEEDVPGPPPPSMDELKAFDNLDESGSDYSEDEDQVDTFFHPEIESEGLVERGRHPDQISIMTATTQRSRAPSQRRLEASRGGLAPPAPSSKFGGSLRSIQSAVSQSRLMGSRRDIAVIEEAPEDEEEAKPEEGSADLGSSKPIVSRKHAEEAAEEKPAAKAKKKQPEVIKLDWWSKYYAAVQDLEEEKAKLVKPIRKKRGKSRKRARAKLLAGFYKLSDAYQKLKEKATRRKREEEAKKKGKEILDAEPTLEAIKAAKANIQRLQIYETELENADDFDHFSDAIEVFKLYRGKKTFSELDERNRYVGKFKGNLVIAPLPIPKAITQTEGGFFPKLPSAEPQKIMVRCYVIKVNNLNPADAGGKADPYLIASLGKKKINDKAGRIHNQLNPVFGKVFEFDATIPQDNELTIQCWDWDRMTADDLLGETKIDIEQRFLSRHRATVGLPIRYERGGYNSWRDTKRPSKILADLAKAHNLRGPYYKPGQVTVGEVTFTPPTDKKQEALDSENVALYALRHFHEIPNMFKLVTEHVERRTLYHPERPGIDQGSVDMWIDIYAKTSGVPGQALDITPRKPKRFDLRVSIWDTKDVILDDSNALTGTDSVDQYIKGYIISPDVDCQQTDVHYRSLKGDGMFNWRFVWPLDYLDAEEKLVYKTKANFFSLVEHEEKISPKLKLQVWDADTFSADDYLGSLELDLTNMPRGAKSAALCGLSMVAPDSATPKASLFHNKRMRGWWPFVQYDKEGNAVLAGKVDMEFQLLTAEDAEKKPAGLGREAPEPMPEPQRPETSYAWYKNPLKLMYYDLWLGMRYKCLLLLIILLGLAFLACFIYQLPSSIAEKIVDAIG